MMLVSHARGPTIPRKHYIFKPLCAFQPWPVEEETIPCGLQRYAAFPCLCPEYGGCLATELLTWACLGSSLQSRSLLRRRRGRKTHGKQITVWRGLIHLLKHAHFFFADDLFYFFLRHFPCYCYPPNANPSHCYQRRGFTVLWRTILKVQITWPKDCPWSVSAVHYIFTLPSPLFSTC